MKQWPVVGGAGTREWGLGQSCRGGEAEEEDIAGRGEILKSLEHLVRIMYLTLWQRGAIEGSRQCKDVM